MRLRRKMTFLLPGIPRPTRIDAGGCRIGGWRGGFEIMDDGGGQQQDNRRRAKRNAQPNPIPPKVF